MKRTIISIAAAALVVASCAGGDDGDARTTDPDTPERTDLVETTDAADADVEVSDTAAGDPDATAELVGLELRWALDDTAVGDVVDYDQPIDWDRHLAGIDAVATFALSGNPGDVDVNLRRPVQVNGDPIEGNSFTLGPEQGTTIPTNDLITSVDDDELIVRWNAGRPLSPITLVDERVKFEELLDIDPDAEDLLFGDADGLAFELDVASIIDLPLPPVDGANEYEYDLVGTIRLANGFELDVNEVADLRAVETERSVVDATDCTAWALATIEQVVEARVVGDGAERVDGPAGSVLIGDLRALDELDERAGSTDCDAGFAAVSLCAAAEAADVDGVTGPGVEIARGYCSIDALDATSAVPTLVDGIAHLVVPAGRDGEPPIRIAISAPAADEWSLLDQGSGASGPFVTGVWRHDDYGVGASYQVGTSPSDDAEAELVEHVQPLLDSDVVVAEGPVPVGDRPGYRLVVDLGLSFPAYEITTAFALDESRIVDIVVRIGDRDIPTTQEAIAAYADCIVSSVVVTPFALTPRPTPSADCASLDPTTVAVRDQVVASTPTTTTTVFVEAGIPTYEPGRLTLPLGTGVRTGEPPVTVALATPAWPVEDLDADQTSSGVVLDAPVVGSSFRASVGFTGSDPGDFDQALERFLSPVNDSEVVSDDRTASVAGREVRIKLAQYESISDDVIRRGVIVMPIDTGRTLHVVLALAPDDPLDLRTEIDRIVASIGVTS